MLFETKEAANMDSISDRSSGTPIWGMKEIPFRKLQLSNNYTGRNAEQQNAAK